MGGQNQETVTQSSGPANPMVTGSLNKILGGLDTAFGMGPPAPYKYGPWTGVGKTTADSWKTGITAANNPAFKTGVDSGFGYLNDLMGNGGFTPGAAGGGRIFEDTMGATARGDFLDGANPYFEGNLSRALDDAGAGVNAAVASGGRFGSGAHVGQLAETLGGLSNSARSGQYEMERDRQLQALTGIQGERQQGIQNTFGAQNQLGQLMNTSLVPSGVLGGIGAAQDANQAAARASAIQQHDQQQNGYLDWLGRLGGILGGAAPVGGTTSTQTTPTVPWYMQLGGLALGTAGQFIR